MRRELEPGLIVHTLLATLTVHTMSGLSAFDVDASILVERRFPTAGWSLANFAAIQAAGRGGFLPGCSGCRSGFMPRWNTVRTKSRRKAAPACVIPELRFHTVL
jgi:hypothetical protein